MTVTDHAAVVHVDYLLPGDLEEEDVAGASTADAVRPFASSDSRQQVCRQPLLHQDVVGLDDADDQGEPGPSRCRYSSTMPWVRTGIVPRVLL